MKGQKKSDRKITYYLFVNQETLRTKWVRGKNNGTLVPLKDAYIYVKDWAKYKAEAILVNITED